MLKKVSNWLRKVANYLSMEPVKEDNKFTLTATITGDNDVDYHFSKDLTPELFAKLVVRMAIMTDGSKFVRILTDNGYNDAFYRLQTTSNNALSSIFEAATAPENKVVVVASEPAAQAEPKPEVVERPVIEALIG